MPHSESALAEGYLRVWGFGFGVLGFRGLGRSWPGAPAFLSELWGSLAAAAVEFGDETLGS